MGCTSSPPKKKKISRILTFQYPQPFQATIIIKNIQYSENVSKKQLKSQVNWDDTPKTILKKLDLQKFQILNLQYQGVSQKADYSKKLHEHFPNMVMRPKIISLLGKCPQCRNQSKVEQGKKTSMRSCSLCGTPIYYIGCQPEPQDYHYGNGQYIPNPMVNQFDYVWVPNDSFLIHDDS